MDALTSLANSFLSFIKTNEFFSALIGGVFVLIGTLIAARHDRQQKKQESRELLQSILEAISTELEVLFSRYMKTMGCIITALTPDQVLNTYYSVTEKYFTMFDSNAKLLGQLKNKELRNSIISTYIDMKGLIEGFKLNNGRMKEYEIFRSNDMTGADPLTQAKLQEIMLLRKDLTNTIKKVSTTD